MLVVKVFVFHFIPNCAFLHAVSMPYCIRTNDWILSFSYRMLLCALSHVCRGNRLSLSLSRRLLRPATQMSFAASRKCSDGPGAGVPYKYAILHYSFLYIKADFQLNIIVWPSWPTLFMVLSYSFLIPLSVSLSISLSFSLYHSLFQKFSISIANPSLVCWCLLLFPPSFSLPLLLFSLILSLPHPLIKWSRCWQGIQSGRGVLVTGSTRGGGRGCDRRRSVRLFHSLPSG